MSILTTHLTMNRSALWNRAPIPMQWLPVVLITCIDNWLLVQFSCCIKSTFYLSFSLLFLVKLVCYCWLVEGGDLEILQWEWVTIIYIQSNKLIFSQLWLFLFLHSHIFQLNISEHSSGYILTSSVSFVFVSKNLVMLVSQCLLACHFSTVASEWSTIQPSIAWTPLYH